MEDNEIINIIEITLKEKLIKNATYIRYTFYELRIKYNLTEQETARFLDLIKIKLQNENYNVYFTGTQFEYNNSKMNVQDNELIVAVKKEKEEIKSGSVQRKSSKKIKRNGNKS